MNDKNSVGDHLAGLREEVQADALASVRAITDPGERLFALANLATVVEPVEAAIPLLHEGIAIAREIDDPYRRANSLAVMVDKVRAAEKKQSYSFTRSGRGSRRWF